MQLKIGNEKEIQVPNVFFISDTHFGHAKIIEYCKRPFENVQEMNEEMVRRWNERVGPDDYVFHLGDISFGGTYLWDDYISKLNGHIILVYGNHDFKNVKQKHLEYIDGAYTFMSILVDGQKIYLGHFPLLCYDGCYDGSVWNLHGHVHLGPNSTGIDTERMKLRTPWQYDVGVDNNNYYPISFNFIKTYFKVTTSKECG